MPMIVSLRHARTLPKRTRLTSDKGLAGVDVSGLSQEAIEALPAAVHMTDAEGRFTFCNETAAALWGAVVSARVAYKNGAEADLRSEDG